MFRSLVVAAFCCAFFAEISAQKKYNCQDGPPKGTNPGICCAKAKSFNETAMKQCFSDFSAIPPRPNKGIQGTMNGLECVFDCVLNATQANPNSVPNPALLIASITRTLSSPTDREWIPVVTAGINYCSGQVNANVAKLRASLKGDTPNGKTICATNSAYMLGCMFTYEFRNCPQTLWNPTKNQGCNDLKDYFNQCTTPLIF